MGLHTNLWSPAAASLRPALRPLTRHNQIRGNQVQQLRQQSGSAKSSVHASKPQLAAAPPTEVPQGASFIPIPIPGHRIYTAALQPITAPFRAYGRAQKRRPLRTQFFTSIVIYFIGDLSSQFVLRNSNTPNDAPDESSDSTTAESKGTIRTFFAENYSSGRSLRAVIIGGLFSGPSYHWFLFLGRSFSVGAPVPRRARFIVSLCYKVVVNQLLFAPLFNSYFFGMHSMLAYPLATPLSPATQANEKSSRIEEAQVVASEYAERFFSKANASAALVRVCDTVPISWWNSCKFWPAVTAFSFTFVPPQHRSVFAGCLAVVWQTYLGMVNQRAAAAEQERARQAVAS